MKKQLPCLLTLLALLILCSHWEAVAQSPQKLRILVTDCANKTPQQNPGLGFAITNALYREFARSAQEQFTVIDKQEVWAAAERLGLPVPEETAANGRWTDADMFRLAGELKANAVVKSEAGMLRTPKKQPPGVGLILTITDVTSRVPINGGAFMVQDKTLPESIRDAVEEVVYQIVHRRVPTGLVLSRMGNRVVLNHGVRDGYQVGDRCMILREVNGKWAVMGEVRLDRSYAEDAEGEVIKDTDGVRAGDAVRVFFVNRFRGGFPSNSKPRSKGRRD